MGLFSIVFFMTQSFSQFYYPEQISVNSAEEIFISDGDVVHANLQNVLDYYRDEVDKLMVDVVSVKEINDAGEVDTKRIFNLWPKSLKNDLTYCVSNEFGENKKKIVSLLKEASQSWMEHGNISFKYKPLEDEACDNKNENVLFNVGVKSGVFYMAKAFFPDYERKLRSLTLNKYYMENEKALLGILKHELGHILGFRHEHTFDKENVCYEDDEFKSLTKYDVESVMHYPQCGGVGEIEDLTLSRYDEKGVAKAYPF